MKLCKFCYELLCRRFNDVKRLNIGPVVNRNRNVSYSYYRQQSTSTNKSSGYKTKEIDLSKFPPEYIRNFSIIAHVDHGKSTLADRLLELTGTIPSDRKNEQVLDKLQVERERGITVKAQTASLFYNHNGETYLLNLVDTPGHVDFHYEVSRSLAACQGVILLIDANQGVQAQTVANMYMALESKLVIIPVLNKIDLKGAQPDVVTKQLQNLFPMEQNDILKISAKHGTGVEDVLKAVIERVPAPAADSSESLKALLFDSWYDKFKGAVCNIAICDGVLRRGDRFVSSYTKLTYDVQDIGILFPDQTSTGVLYAGQVGYMIGNIKKSSEAKVGDTLYLHGKPVTPLPGFKPAKAMVFAGIYPPDQSQYNFFKEAITKLTLNDSSVDVHTDHSAALGQGWRLGFLGLLHMDVFQQRLEQEFNASVIVTAPNIPYKVKITGPKNIKKYGGEEITILNPCKLPDPSIISHYYEPIVMATIIFPEEYIGGIQQLVMERRGEQKDSTYIDDTRVLMKVQFPLNEILTDFFDELKSLTSGYASFDYEDAGYQESDLVKVTFLLNDKEIEDLTSVWHKGKARNMAKLVCSRLKDSIPRQLFKIVLLGRVGNQTIAREELQALKKDVTAKCYGGDITRKNKLLQKQMEGKKRMRQIGKVQVPKDAFISVLRK